MWNSHLCFNWQLTRCDRTSFPGITDLHLARLRSVARVKTAFERIATMSVASFASGSSPTSHRALHGALFRVRITSLPLTSTPSFFPILDLSSPSNSLIFDSSSSVRSSIRFSFVFPILALSQLLSIRHFLHPSVSLRRRVRFLFFSVNNRENIWRVIRRRVESRRKDLI